MADKKINVRFPDQIRVESPEIDSINTTTQRISNWLHTDLREIVRPLQVLPAIPEVLNDLKERLVQQFQLHFSGMVAVEMKTREANIRVAERKVEFIEGQVGRKHEQLGFASGRVEDRYTRMADSIAEEHDSYLRQLDSHVYDITEEIYPKQIQAKFSFASTPFWGELARHSSESAMARSACLMEGYEEARGEMEDFLAGREACYAAVVTATTDTVGEGSYEIPYWFAEVEDTETGEKQTEVLFPWDLDEATAAPHETQIELLKQVVQREAVPEVMVAMSDEARKGLDDRLQSQHDVPADEISRFEKDCRAVYGKTG